VADERTDGTGPESGEIMNTETVHFGAEQSGTVQSGTVQPETVGSAPAAEPLHADVITTADPAPPARRRGPDPLALIVGLATLVMAVFAFAGELPDLSGFDPRWLLAGGAVAVGLVLLVGSLRNRSGGRRGGG
jgi:hypothetical protein